MPGPVTMLVTRKEELDMATTIQTAPMANTAGLARYRQAERDLWHAYGLEPIERSIEVSLPRATLRLRILEVGEGDPVLFIPGTGGTGPYWAPLIRELRGVRCVMIDRPGWGLSSPFDYRDLDYGEVAATILSGALDALGLDRVDVVGASIGALWGLRLAQREPGRVRRLAALGGAPIADLPAPRFIRLLASPLGALIVRIPSSERMLRGQLGAIGHGASLAAGRMDDFLAWRVAFDRETPSLRHERAMVRAVLARDGWRAGFVPTGPDLEAVSAPFRMLFGSADPTGSVELWRAFSTRLAHGELQIVEGAGHMPWWDEPAVVGRSVREFLSRPAG